MNIAPGARLGPYEILAAIGAGGMGEIYRARDTRLDRSVAIKVLPPALASDPMLRERFEREARAISSLNHPHICTLFDVGRDGDVDFLVLEHLDGETLARRLERGALPPADALRIAIEIASALVTAHKAGVVHRDVKPANIMLTKAGAKLLDFGLAKPAAPAVATSGLSMLPTTPPGITAQGTILGTFQYMAPEQIEGLEADPRTDIFAFGAVLFEMLTGRTAFVGKTRASLLGAILKDEPPRVSSLQPIAPPALDRVVSTCLAKDSEERYQTALDLLRDLRWAASDSHASTSRAAGDSAGAHAVPAGRVPWVIAAVLGALAVAGGAVAIQHFREAPPAAQSVQFTVTAPENLSFGGPLGGGTGQATQLAVSPDGRSVAFVAGNERTFQIFLRSLDSAAARPLAGTEGGSFPFWSPDARFLAFFADGKLKKLQIGGGPAIVLCDAPSGRGGTWSRDGVILFSPSTAAAGIARVSATGGSAIPVTKLDTSRGETSHRWPHFLPDGHHFLYTATTGTCCPASKPAVVMVAALDGDETPLFEVESSSAYASGHLLFVRDGTLMAQPFDLRTSQLAGGAFPVAEHVDGEGSRYMSFSASVDGVLAYATGSLSVNRRLTWFDRTGRQLGMLGQAATYSNVTLSPDESRVAVSQNTGAPATRDVWILDVARAIPSRFTFDPGDDLAPVWSPDGQTLAFFATRGTELSLRRKSVNGAGNEEALLTARGSLVPSDWSRDGKFIAYTVGAAVAGSSDVMVLPLIGERAPIAIARTAFLESQPAFSPDGRWIAYSSNETGQMQVFVQPFPPTGRKFQVSGDGGTYPRWRADGRELYYVEGNSSIVAVLVDPTHNFDVGAPQRLFNVNIATPNGGPQYAVTRDGKRFLVNVLQPHTSAAPLTVVTNWLTSVQR